MNNDEIKWKDCWKKPVKVQYKEITETAEIETREGKLYSYAGKDVLIKGVRGEVYPCKIDIFSDTYTTTAPLSEEQIRAAARAEGYKEGQIDTVKWISKAIKELDDKLINPDYDDLKAVIEAVQKQFKVD